MCIFIDENLCMYVFGHRVRKGCQIRPPTLSPQLDYYIYSKIYMCIYLCHFFSPLCSYSSQRMKLLFHSGTAISFRNIFSLPRGNCFNITGILGSRGETRKKKEFAKMYRLSRVQHPRNCSVSFASCNGILQRSSFHAFYRYEDISMD